MSNIRVRFAPSPTGYLHIGGARTTLFNWLYAKHHKGTFVLRIEDTDEVRSTNDSVYAIVDSLHWLGLHWDEGPEPSQYVKDVQFKVRHDAAHAPYFQMERHAAGVYKKYVDELLKADKAYKCYCSKDDLDAMRRQAQLEKRPPLYDRRCSRLSDAQRAANETAGKPFSIRIRMPEDGVTIVEDQIRGNVEFDNRLQQDLVIVKTTGGPTYNFACVIDDHLMGMTHVIRGDEHLSNTPSQIVTYRALGWEPPKFAHLSMILGPDKTKLSKRHGATSVTEYRDNGYLPEALRNYLALLGWATADSQDIFAPEELVEKFSIERCQKNPAVFDSEKLKWMNGEYLRKLSPKDLFEKAKPFLEKAGLMGENPEMLFKAVAIEQEKYKLLSEIPGLIDFFFRDVVFDEKSVEKVLLKEGAAVVLEKLAKDLAGLADWKEPALEARIRAFCDTNGYKPGQVFHPIRVAVSGRQQGPTLFGMLELLGKDKVIARADAARAMILSKTAKAS